MCMHDPRSVFIENPVVLFNLDIAIWCYVSVVCPMSESEMEISWRRKLKLRPILWKRNEAFCSDELKWMISLRQCVGRRKLTCAHGSSLFGDGYNHWLRSNGVTPFIEQLECVTGTKVDSLCMSKWSVFVSYSLKGLGTCRGSNCGD
jgi:hypothetical protein